MSKLTIKVTAKEGLKFKPYSINGYLISKPLTSDNSGFSKWGFGTKDDKEFFIKEFLNPVYPSDSVKLSDDIRKRKISQCMEWYEEKKRIYDMIVDSQTGNLVVPLAFFRNDSHFYLVTDKIEKSSLDYKTICKFALSRKLVLLKVLTNCFVKLSENNVVHADIKPDNLLIKETKNGFFTIKVIDFDASYLVDNPPFGEEIQGDPVYYAPETFLAIMEEPVKLTSKVDVFGLGIIFHQILCGEMPEFDKEYDYIYEAVLNDSDVKINSIIPENLKNLILNMLKKDSDDRYSFEKIFNEICKIENENRGSLSSDTKTKPVTVVHESIKKEEVIKEKSKSRWHIIDSFE